MDLNDFDTQLHENIRALLLNNELSEGAPAFGVATQVVHHGLGSLSWRQRFIYLGQVVPLLRNMESRRDASKSCLPKREVCHLFQRDLPEAT
jgi:hypothetical protein